MKKEHIVDRMSSESYYKYTFDSGFTLVHYPKKDRFLKAAYLSVGFGSTDLKGSFLGEDFELPSGTAHFLEHKLFEGEKDLFDRMSALGASVNAFTSHDMTCYYFNTPINFKEALDLLLEIPVKPGYSKEGIEKEREVIAHEIRMYENDLDYQTFHRALDYLYPVHPVGRDIAGTIESLERIDWKVLDRALSSYYVPSNLLLFIIGDFSSGEIEEILASLPEFYLKKVPGARSIYPEDSFGSGHKRLEIMRDIPGPSFSYLVKLPAGRSRQEGFEDSLYYSILLSILFGEGSSFYTRHYEKGDFLDFSSSFSYGSGYRLLSFSGEGRGYQPVEEALMKMLEEDFLVDEEKVSRVKRRLMGRYLLGFNSLSGIAANFSFLHHREVDFFDYLPLMEKTILNGRKNPFEGPSCFSVTLKEK